MTYEYKRRILREEKIHRILSYLESVSVDGVAQSFRKDLLKGTALTRGQFEYEIIRIKEEGYLIAEDQYEESLGSRTATRYTLTEKGKKFLSEYEENSST